MADTLSTLSIEAKQYYNRNLLYRARQAQTFYKYALKTDVPMNGGNSVSWRRFNALGLATTPITESITPVGTPLSLSEVTATVSEYGNYVTISDAVNLMAIDKVMTQASDVLGQNGGESIEKIVANLMQTGTNVIYATGNTRASVGVANPLTVSLLRKALMNLDINNTHRFSGSEENDMVGQGSYVAFVHPAVMNDIYNDQELKNALQYNDSAKFFDGAIASLYGIMLVQTTLAPEFVGAGASGANVYGTMIVGQEAFGVVDIGGTGKMEMIMKAIGSAGADDPLNQRGTIGWKAWQVPEILNNNFMVRIETGATNG